MMLLSRVADRIYWAARYMERAEDTARIVRAHGELTADLPAHTPAPWRPLVAIVGSGVQFERPVNSRQRGAQSQSQSQSQGHSHSGSHSGSQSQSQSQSHGGSQSQSQSQSAVDDDVEDDSSEMTVASFLVSDRTNPGSVTSCVVAARENLRTTRDTVPRDGWHTLNDTYLYVTTEADRGVDRRFRDRFLWRVIADSRRLDGVLATAMTHDEAYAMWRLGRAIERADMTTRVLGVRAAAVLSLPRASSNGDGSDLGSHDEVHWMGVLKSLQGLQMYQRAVRRPIEGALVVKFLLDHDRFPRAVRALLREIRRALRDLPDPEGPLDAVDHVEAVLREATTTSTSGEELDRAMDALQVAIGQLDRRITERYLQVGP